MATGTDFGDILSAAIHGGYVAHLTDQTYTISSPIVIFVDSTIQGALGIDGGGATFVSQVTDGSPLIRIVVGPGVDFRYLTLSNFTLAGQRQRRQRHRDHRRRQRPLGLQLDRRATSPSRASAAMASTSRAARSRAWSRTRG